MLDDFVTGDSSGTRARPKEVWLCDITGRIYCVSIVFVLGTMCVGIDAAAAATLIGSELARDELLAIDQESGNHELVSSLSMGFFDTTSVSFESEGVQPLGEYGLSKDHRPARKQMVIGVVLDEQGRPICCEAWPGGIRPK